MEKGTEPQQDNSHEAEKPSHLASASPGCGIDFLSGNPIRPSGDGPAGGWDGPVAVFVGAGGILQGGTTLGGPFSYCLVSFGTNRWIPVVNNWKQTRNQWNPTFSHHDNKSEETTQVTKHQWGKDENHMFTATQICF